MTNRLRQKYEKEVISTLSKEFDIKNRMALPKIVKVVVNMGVGDTLKNKEAFEAAKRDLASITGQFPQVRRAKVSVASFGIRRGQDVGIRVTLRKNKMYAFLDKFFSINLARLRDFRGVAPSGFDKFGNYTLGVQEDSIFPEIDISKSQARGLEITIVTNAKNVEKSKRLLELLGMPFAKDGSG